MQEGIPFTPQLAASSITQMVWLIPAVPIVASGIIALLKQPLRKTAAALAIGSLAFSLLLSLIAFGHVLTGWANGAAVRETVNFTWIQVGSSHVELGWVLDPLSAVMMVMVTFVGLLIFIYSTGYMAHDENFTRFFCFLSLFAGAMLGVVISNSILLLFMNWELVGLTSYLLIGFWYQKPSAAAAAKKAFLTTRVGDVFFLLGIVWLFAQTGTLLFYNHGGGAIEALALGGLLVHPAFGLTAAGAIGLLIFAGAAGKSGQLPLHVWLPDAMEGPTPVSALIHAATMVAAGVYLIARVYPLMEAGMSPRRKYNCTYGRDVGGCFHRCLRSANRCRAKRYQAHPCLFHHLPTRLHDGGARHRGRCGGDVPPHYPCVFQGASLHGCRLSDSWQPRGAGHTADGRLEIRNAGYLPHLHHRHAGTMRISVVILRILVQGRNTGSGPTLEPGKRSVLHAGPWRAADGVLHDAAGELRFFRQRRAPMGMRTRAHG